MAYSVIVPLKIMATDVGTLNRTAVSGSVIENGNVFVLNSYSGSTGYSEVFFTEIPQSGSMNNLWMAYTPEVVVTVSGNSKFKGIDQDPRNFSIAAADLIDAFKPQVGDLILMSTDAFSGAKSSNTHANARDGYHDLAWGTVPTASALCLKYLSTTYITIGSGSSIGDTRLVAYVMEVLAN